MIAIYLIIGVVLLILGAELLVRGASGLAFSLGISKLIVGLTVVAFGTSAPELFVSTVAAVKGESDISLGNVVGSNIGNILVILGLSALLAPIAVRRPILSFDLPVMIAVSILCLVFSLDGTISRVEGFLFLLGLVLYIRQLVVREGKNAEAAEPESGRVPTRFMLGTFAAAGLILLVLGSSAFVRGATELARAVGASELVIGLTIVALGTSLPELATSALGAMRGQADIAVGNVVGSNILNILGVLGLSALLHPITVPAAAISFDIPIMVIVSLACIPIFHTGIKISRREGALLLSYYLVYAFYLILASSSHEALVPFESVMLAVIIPATVIAIAYSYFNHAAESGSIVALELKRRFLAGSRSIFKDMGKLYRRKC